MFFKGIPQKRKTFFCAEESCYLIDFSIHLSAVNKLSLIGLALATSDYCLLILPSAASAVVNVFLFSPHHHGYS